MNLLEETKEAIEESGHWPSEILFIGSERSGHECTWEQFCVLADEDYEAGYGSPKVAQDLVIAFGDGDMLRRHEYDGSEWWEHFPAFKKPARSIPITSLICPEAKVGWVNLAEINDGSEAQ